MRILRQTVGAVLLGLLSAISGASAQGVDPTSSQNVAPSVGEDAELQAKRRQLFAQMMGNPADLDTAFAYAALSVQMGDLEGAISTLERMLIFAPGLPRLQFELGVLYFRLGAFEVANTYFNAVAAAPGVPADIAGQVEMYQAAIEQRSAPSSFSGVIATGVRIQSNANAGPDSPFVTIGGFEFELNESALSQPDVNGFVTLNLNSSIDLQNQGDRYDTTLSAYGALYRTMRELDTGLVELRTGPTFNLQRFEIDNATLGIYALGGGAILGGEPYMASAGLAGTVTMVLDARSRVQLQVEGRHEEFFDSDLRPSASDRSGQRYTASTTLQHQLMPNLGAFVTLNAQRRVTAFDYMSDWQLGGSVGLIVKFAPPIPILQDDWSLSASIGARHELADAPDKVFSPTDPETKNVVFVQGALTIPLGEGFSLQTSGTYSVSQSNYDMGNYDNYGATVALSKGF